MPALPPADGVTRCVMNFLYDGQPCANVLHYAAQPVGDAPDPEVMGENLKDWWIATLQPYMPSTLTLTSIVCTDLSEVGAPSYEYTSGLPASGVNVQPQLPNHVTVCISLRTALRGRSYRGRLYHVGMREDMVVGNQLSGTWPTNFETYYEALLVEPIGVGMPDAHWGVLSYWSAGVLRPNPVFTPATSVTCDAFVDSMRSRLPGR